MLLVFIGLGSYFLLPENVVLLESLDVVELVYCCSGVFGLVFLRLDPVTAVLNTIFLLTEFLFNNLFTLDIT
jgi:hypothetical protein